MTDLASMLISFTDNVTESAWTLMWALGGLIGVILAGMIVSRFASASSGNPGATHVSMFEVFGILIVSVFLFSYANTLNIMVQTGGFDDATYSAVSYAGAEGMGELTAVVNAALTLTTIFGGVFSFRGWLMVPKSFKPHGGDHIYSAITHIIFGGLLVVIPQVISRFGESMGVAWG